MKIRVCYSTCWACKFNHHFDPPKWHTWADEEDVLAAGSDHVLEQPCACPCAGVRESATEVLGVKEKDVDA